MGGNDMFWIYLVLEKGKRRGFVKRVMNQRIPQKVGNFLACEEMCQVHSMGCISSNCLVM